jgi:hypothetical protein
MAIARTKKLTDSNYSATIAASEEAIRSQVDGAIQEVLDLGEANFTAKAGDHLGTWQGLQPTQAEPGLSATVESHLTDVSSWINVKNPPWAPMVAAKGDGITDDTVALNALPEGYIYFIPKSTGNYMIKGFTDDGLGHEGFRTKANTTYIWAPGAIFEEITSPTDIYSIIWVDTENTILINPTVEGDRETHVGTDGQMGYGINIRNYAKCKIYNPVAYNCWGDGCIVNTLLGSDVEIYNLDSYNNRRQGLSVMCADRLRVKGKTLRTSNGTAPQMGLDIEPNYPTDILNDVLFEDIDFDDNASAGFGIYGGGAFPTEYKISFVNCRTKGNVGVSAIIQDVPYAAKGSINFINTKFRKDGLHIKNSFANVFVDGMLCEDTKYPFKIENTKADTVCGNLVARNVEIIDSDSTLLKAVNFITSSAVTGNNIKDVDIEIVRHNLANTKITTNGDKKFLGKRSIKIDSVKDTTGSILANNMPIYLYQKITNTGATADISCDISYILSRALGATAEFEVVAPYYIAITDVDTNILPFAGFKIRSNVVGSRIKLRHNGTNWIVVEQIGTWAVY